MNKTTWHALLTGRDSLNAKPRKIRLAGELSYEGEYRVDVVLGSIAKVLQECPLRPAIVDEVAVGFVRHEDKPPVPEVEVSL